MRLLLLILVFVASKSFAQEKPNLQNLMPKRFIDKAEVLIGPSFCFNYGNQFIENHGSSNFNNQREFKMGYSIEVGVYHPVSKWLDLNMKLSWDQKGTKAKFVTASNDPGYHNLVQTVESNYSYNYLTISFIPRIHLDKKERYSILIGGYYSIIKGVNAKVSWNSHSDNDSTSSYQSFHGRQVYTIDKNGGIIGVGTSIGLSSFQNDYGAVVGFGYFVPFKKSHGITLQLVGKMGLLNINKQVFAPPGENPPERNNTLSFMIGYLYHRANRIL